MHNNVFFRAIHLLLLFMVLFFISCIGRCKDFLNKKTSVIIEESPLNKTFKSDFVVATWNIGHFSNGSKTETQIKESQFSQKVNEYKKLVYNDLSPDVLCLNEYSTIFCHTESKDYFASSVFLNNFNNRYIGEQLGYSCNAIFSMNKIKNIKKMDFECSMSYINKIPKAAQYYYIEGDIIVGKKKVKLVCVHLVGRFPELCYKQMSELMNKYKNFDRVVMCGDWNSLDFSLFKENGFNLANDGSLKTYPFKSYPLDNIIVKGMKISNVRMVKTDLSDHYPLACSISIN